MVFLIYEHGRGDETRYISIYPCPHENLYFYSTDYYHGLKCSYCQKAVIYEEHTWGSDNECTVCGTSAVTVTYTFKEQDRNGNEVTRNIQIPRYSSFTMPEAENVPDGMEFVGWTGDAAMANFTINNNKYKAAAFMLCCDDAERSGGELRAFDNYGHAVYDETPECIRELVRFFDRIS